MSRMLQGRDVRARLDVQLLLQYFALEFGSHQPKIDDATQARWLAMLTMALEMRALVVVLDGIDEAAGRRDIISSFVRDALVPYGLRVVCTSRPEGVDIEEFKEHFVIVDLKPLSDDQQKQAIEMQLKLNPFGKTFSENLLRFCEIRKEHDRIYREFAFPTAGERDRIESFEVPNLQFLNGKGGKRDGNMRQKTRDGKFCTAQTHVFGQLMSSSYLRKLCATLTPSVLAKLDEMLDAGALLAEKDELKVRIGRLLSINPDDHAVDVANRLVLLVHKRRQVLDPSKEPPKTEAGKRALEYVRARASQTTVATLWPCIATRTDQIYATIEDLLPIFHGLMEMLIMDAGLDVKKDLMLARGLKDPVRTHEKALDDYIHDFDDFTDDIRVIPEACVIDMLRGRALCPDGSHMIVLLEMLSKGYERVLRGTKAKLSLLRAKSKMHHEDPTHFRCIVTNLILSYDGVTTIAELQIHHSKILEYNDIAHAHGPYEFFRSLLADAYQDELDAMLERVVVFLEEIKGVPVLLAMLVLIFKHREEGSTEPLPADRYELYTMAMRLATKRAD
eukprot:6273580-Prymnesium_polylepis.1